MKSAVKLAFLFSLAALCALRAQENGLTPAEQKVADMRLPELDRTALAPEKREPAKVLETERNPFGLVSLPPPESEEPETIEAETEEMKLRRVLGNMRISGVTGMAGDYRVLIGSMQLRQGETVPKMFSDQAEILRVETITDREVILSFAEKDPSLPPRTIGLAYDLRPRPQSLLPGEIFGKLVPFTPKGAPDLKPLENRAVKAISKGAESGGFQGFIERSVEAMGEPVFRQADEKTTEKAD